MADPGRLLLIAGYLGALAAGAYVLQRTTELPQAPGAQDAPALPVVEIPPAAINSLAAYEAITERPLFTASRRPQSDQAATDDTPPATLRGPAPTVDGLRLSAVLRGPENLTILVEDQTGQTRTLHQGDRLGAWQIEEILDDRVVVVSGAERKTLLVHQFDALPTLPPRVKRPTRRSSQRQRPRQVAPQPLPNYRRLPRPAKADEEPAERAE